MNGSFFSGKLKNEKETDNLIKFFSRMKSSRDPSDSCRWDILSMCCCVVLIRIEKWSKTTCMYVFLCFFCYLILSSARAKGRRKESFDKIYGQVIE